jgi:hypothetical protein
MTCWRRLRVWEKAGVWEKLHKLLDTLNEAGEIGWLVKSLFGLTDGESQRGKKGEQGTGPNPTDKGNSVLRPPARSAILWSADEEYPLP